MMKDLEEYWVMGTFRDTDGEEIEDNIGTVTMPKDATPEDMPISLEINGVEYFPMF
jgi:hypothetical protein